MLKKQRNFQKEAGVKRNVGGIDKILRFVVGIVAILVGLLAPISAGLRIIALVVAAVALFTAVFGF
jgi:hypothetical protein